MLRTFRDLTTDRVVAATRDTEPMKRAQQRHQPLDMSCVDLDGVRDAGGVTLDELLEGEGEIARGDFLTQDELERRLQTTSPVNRWLNRYQVDMSYRF